MEKTKLDVVIPIVKTDIPALKNNIDNIIKNLDVKRIVLIGAENIKGTMPDKYNIEYIDENSLYDSMTFEYIKTLLIQLCGTGRRTGWYFQQFIKMAYSLICENEFYLVWDGDTVPITTIDFFDSETGKPYLAYRKHEKCDAPFYPSMSKLLPDGLLKKTVQESYIAEHMLIKCSIMRELIKNIEENNELNGTLFFEKILHSIDRSVMNLSGFSEYEVYATYIQKKYPDVYIERFWNNLRNGRTFFGTNATDEELAWASKWFISASLEDFDKQFWVCKLLCNSFFRRKLEFITVYSMINPIYKVKYALRLKIRDLVYGIR